MTEQEILQDVLIASKFLLNMYNQFGVECSNPSLRSLFLDQHAEVCSHNFEIFEMMKQKGYYPITEAAEKDVSQAVKMHTQMQKDLDEKLK